VLFSSSCRPVAEILPVSVPEGVSTKAGLPRFGIKIIGTVKPTRCRSMRSGTPRSGWSRLRITPHGTTAN